MFSYLWEENLILMLQQWGDWLEPIMLFASQFGFPLNYLFMIIVYWCVDSRLGRRFSFFLLSTAGLNAVFKSALQHPRPFWVNSQIKQIGATYTTFGMPSGHAMSSFSWAFVAQAIQKRWAWVVAGLLIIFIGVSRVFLGVHYPSQVLVGWLLSAVIFWMVLKYEEPVSRWIQEKSNRDQLLLILFAAGIFLSIGWLFTFIFEGKVIPEQWIQNMQSYLDAGDTFNPFSSTGMLEDGGAFLGFAYAIMRLEKRGGYDANGSFLIRIGRLAVGTIFVVISIGILDYLGSSLLLDQGSEQIQVLWAFAYNFVVTFTIYFVAPVIFQHINLAPNATYMRSIPRAKQLH